MAKKDWMVSQADLDDDQLAVLNLTLNKSCIVTGCAGSGKSVLALIKAQRIQNEKQTDDYQIIVFTKALCGYMNAGREELGLHNSFNYHWIWEHKLNCPSRQYTIVDEIQDFSNEEITEFIRATTGKFFFYGDTAQSLYEGLKSGISPVEKLGYLSCLKQKDFKTFSLYRNYRLPLPVAKVAYYVDVTNDDDFNPNIYKSKETAVPFLWKFTMGLEAQIAQIAQIIQNDTTKTDVAILLPHNADVKHIHELLGHQGVKHECKYEEEDWHNSVNTLDFNTTNPKVMTYHSAKGLQFETVFLPMLQPVSRESDQKALYVAMTRTYRFLYLMYSGTLPSPLSEVPTDLFKCRTF